MSNYNSNNNSFTSYKIGPNVVNGHTFTCSDRYSFADAKILGRGSFGVVTTAIDTETNKIIAIKRIRPYANDDWDARHTLREIRLMRFLGPHPNVISLYNLSQFDEKAELYMMMELMDCDLHRVIQSKQSLTPKHYKCFLKQILEGIKAMHEVGVFHRDLKPGNILVSKDCQIRITDFGLARFMDENTRQGNNKVNPMTEYVVTRWYRAPELLLSPNSPYDEAIDLWSIGCILAELYRRKPLFPGKSHAHQVQMIFEVMGYSVGEHLGFNVTSEAAGFLEKRCIFRKQPLSNVVPGLSDDAYELLEELLSVNPARRPSAATALRSKYLDDADVICDYTKRYVTKPTSKDFEFEQSKFTLEELRGMIVDEVRYYENILTGGRPPIKNNANALSSSFSSNNGSYAVPIRGSFDSFSTANSRKGSFTQNGDDSVRSSWDSGYGGKMESRDEDCPASQLQTQRNGHGGNGNHNGGSHAAHNMNSRSYIPADKLIDKLSALRLSGGNPHPNSGIASSTTNTTTSSSSSSSSHANGVPDTDDTVHETYTKMAQDSTAIDIKPRRSSVRGAVGSSIISSSRPMNSNSPNPRTPRTPSPGQMNNNTNLSSTTSTSTNAAASNKANVKYRPRIMSTSGAAGGLPTGPMTNSDPMNQNNCNNSLSRSYNNKSSLAAAGAAMMNGSTTSSSVDYSHQRKGSDVGSIFSQLHGKYNMSSKVAAVSNSSDNDNDSYLDPSESSSDRKTSSSSHDRRPSNGFMSSQNDSDSMQQSKVKSFLGVSAFGRR